MIMFTTSNPELFPSENGQGCKPFQTNTSFVGNGQQEATEELEIPLKAFGTEKSRNTPKLETLYLLCWVKRLAQKFENYLNINQDQNEIPRQDLECNCTTLPRFVGREANAFEC